MNLLKGPGDWDCENRIKMFNSVTGPKVISDHPHEFKARVWLTEGVKEGRGGGGAHSTLPHLPEHLYKGLSFPDEGVPSGLRPALGCTPAGGGTDPGGGVWMKGRVPWCLFWPSASVDLLSPFRSSQCVFCVHPMCSSNYRAENTPHSFGRAPAAELSICGRETGKGNGFLDAQARFLFFQLQLLLLWVKLERARRWNGFGWEEQNAGQGQGKAERFDCFRWLRATVRPS